MKVNLSKVELKALILLCGKSFAARELAAGLEVKPSFVSRLLKRLVQLNLVTLEKQGAVKIISLSSAGHSQAFKKLYSSRPNLGIEEFFSGKAIEILIPLTSEKLSYRELLQEASCSQATFLKLRKKLGGIGALTKVNDKFEIPDALLREFVTQYADNIQLILQRELVGFILAKRIGKHVVIRTESEKVPECFNKSGVNRLVEEGLEIIQTNRNDYYFNFDEEKRRISTEEAFTHALLLSTLQSRSEFIILGIFLKQYGSKLNPLLLRKAAKKYNVEDDLTKIREALDLSEKLREYNA